MNRKLHIQNFKSSLLAAAFVFGLVFFAPNTYAAYVPAIEKASTGNALNADDVYQSLAVMRNREIEVLAGRKLTIREKAGLYLLRRQIRKKGAGITQNRAAWEDKCFTMYLKNGDIIEVKLIQISTTEIKYQRCKKPDDPEIVIAKADVFSIKDSNGEAIYSTKDDSWKKGYASAEGETDRLALASGITGLAAVTFGLLFWPLGLAAGIAAGVMGIVSLSRFKKNRNLRGEGWAITGIVAGGLWLFFGVLIMIALASGWW
jgi:hypothetical protein